jgi:glycosyltransferase involved in cell wall biosynthesis/peptidoglycan/xylan/chitin deacetylase (PgdA/CDA1 family)
MFLNSLYYKLKPLIPRRLQIQIRRQIVLRKRGKYTHIWPIDEKAALPPEGWKGWPGGKKFALVLTHDVETAEGLDKCLKLMELDKSLGFRSSFNFIADEYRLLPELRLYLEQQGFEVGIHGLRHNANLFRSKTTFQESARRINQYLKDWQSVGFRAPSMYHNLEWIKDLNIEYDSSTFDTDPFEPQPDAVGTIFPFWVPRTPTPESSALNTQHSSTSPGGYIELPYTLPQDFTLFVIMGERNIDIWKQKLDWIAEHGGMALLITHPDYMDFSERSKSIEEYPAKYYKELLNYIKGKYSGQYWNVLPRDLANFCIAARGDKQAWPNGFKSRVEYGLNRRNMRACIIAYTFYEVDFRVKRYAEALVKAGYEVDVYALRRKGQSRRENLNGVNIYHLQERDYNEKGLRSFLVRMVVFFGRVFFLIIAKQLQYRYSLVHVHNPPDFLVFSTLVPKILGAKIIFDMHENLPEFYCAKFNKSPNSFLAKVLLFFEKIGFQFADFTIVAHDLLRARVIRRDGVPEKKCMALLNYPSRAFFKPLSAKKEKEEFTILYPGTVSYQHGIDIALEAMAIVKKECKEAKLEIYARSSNPTYYEELLKLRDRLDLNGSVSFYNPVPMEEVGKIVDRASIGVVPKRGGIFGSEAFSTKILEFMAVGIPVIASKTKIDAYYFDDSMVMFFEPEDPVDLARCILELYRDADKRKSLVKNGFEFIERNNWETKNQVYLDTVKELIGRGKNKQDLKGFPHHHG